MAGRAGGWREVAGGRWVGGWLEVAGMVLGGGVAGLVGSVLRIATEPNRNSAILAIHIPLNTAYVLVSTEPPDYNHVYNENRAVGEAPYTRLGNAVGALSICKGLGGILCVM